MSALGLEATRSTDASRRADLHARHGRVSNLIGLIIEATGLEAEVGELCDGRDRPQPRAGPRRGGRLPRLAHAADAARRDARHRARARRARHRRAVPGRAWATSCSAAWSTGSAARSTRVGEAPRRPAPRRRSPPPPDPLERPPIEERVSLGVRALDALVPCGRGQRLGIFAGSGVGKSSLLGHDRPLHLGRRERDLPGRRARPRGARVHRARPGLGASPARVVVVATSDQPALVRIKAAFTATTIAEYFRDQGNDVMLMMDSVTRFAMAQREVGPGDRRAARHARLHAERLRACCRSCSSAPAPAATARSPASTRCSSTATT